MRSLFFVLCICIITVFSVDADSTGQIDDPITNMLNGLRKIPVDQPDKFDQLTEKLIGHLITPPIILGLADNKMMDNTKFPGMRIPAEQGGPRGTPEDAEIIYQNWCHHMAVAIETLMSFEGQANQYEAVEFLQKVQDVANNFHDLFDARADPTNPDQERALNLREGQQIEITNGAMVPFRLGMRGVKETSFQESMHPGGSSFVLKEFMGLKAIIVCGNIPIWQEPWYARRRIIGYRRVYYLKYVPCEYLKSIIYKDTPDGVDIRISTTQHCDRALLSYWNYPL